MRAGRKWGRDWCLGLEVGSEWEVGPGRSDAGRGEAVLSRRSTQEAGVGGACSVTSPRISHPCRVLVTCHDDAARFVRLLSGPGGRGLAQEDFQPLLQVTLPLPLTDSSPR